MIRVRVKEKACDQGQGWGVKGRRQGIWTKRENGETEMSGDTGWEDRMGRQQ